MGESVACVTDGSLCSWFHLNHLIPGIEMHQSEINNWIRVAAQLEAAGLTETMFYQRARAISLGEPDPLQSFGVEADVDHNGP